MCPIPVVGARLRVRLQTVACLRRMSPMCPAGLLRHPCDPVCTLKRSALRREPQEIFLSLFWRFGVLAVKNQGAVRGHSALYARRVLRICKEDGLRREQDALRGASLERDRPLSISVMAACDHVGHAGRRLRQPHLPRPRRQRSRRTLSPRPPPRRPLRLARLRRQRSRPSARTPTRVLPRGPDREDPNRARRIAAHCAFAAKCGFERGD